jgi:hypothetical protein
MRNTTNQKLSKVEVYYRRGYEGGTLGGKCYVEVLEDVEPGELLYLDPDYWTDKSKIVNVLIYPDLDTGN